MQFSKIIVLMNYWEKSTCYEDSNLVLLDINDTNKRSPYTFWNYISLKWIELIFKCVEVG